MPGSAARPAGSRRPRPRGVPFQPLLCLAVAAVLELEQVGEPAVGARRAVDAGLGDLGSLLAAMKCGGRGGEGLLEAVSLVGHHAALVPAGLPGPDEGLQLARQRLIWHGGHHPIRGQHAVTGSQAGSICSDRDLIARIGERAAGSPQFAASDPRVPHAVRPDQLADWAPSAAGTRPGLVNGDRRAAFARSARTGAGDRPLAASTASRSALAASVNLRMNPFMTSPSRRTRRTRRCPAPLRTYQDCPSLSRLVGDALAGRRRPRTEAARRGRRGACRRGTCSTLMG